MPPRMSAIGPPPRLCYIPTLPRNQITAVNLLLFETSELDADHRLEVQGRRHHHIREILGLNPGDSVRVGQIDGAMGSAEVLHVGGATTRLAVTLTQRPPPPLPLTLVLALPRPKVLHRTLQALASLGVKDIHLIHSYRVEKSYWQTPWLREERIREQLLLGLEQAADTTLPRVRQHRRFKPFVEDDLPGIAVDTRALVAHPHTATPCPLAPAEPITLAAGPEGGFIPYEVKKLAAAGFEAVTLGPRILRVETAIPYLVARLTAGS